MLRSFGVDWALGQTGDKRKFFLLLVHLACVETRMTLENASPQYVSNYFVFPQKNIHLNTLCWKETFRGEGKGDNYPGYKMCYTMN